RILSSPEHPVRQDPERGLDHGAYVPLMEMYPEADVPVLQISMPTLDPRRLFEIGRKLSELRDQGVLIVGSGFSTHNLREMNWHAGPDGDPPSWSVEFDDWLSRTLAAGDIDSLLDFQRAAPAAHIAHPRTEHFAPLFVALGAAVDTGADAENAVEGFWFGRSRRAVQFAWPFGGPESTRKEPIPAHRTEWRTAPYNGCLPDDHDQVPTRVREDGCGRRLCGGHPPRRQGSGPAGG